MLALVAMFAGFVLLLVALIGHLLLRATGVHRQNSPARPLPAIAAVATIIGTVATIIGTSFTVAIYFAN